jgi:hypothetical protein
MEMRASGKLSESHCVWEAAADLPENAAHAEMWRRLEVWRGIAAWLNPAGDLSELLQSVQRWVGTIFPLQWPDDYSLIDLVREGDEFVYTFVNEGDSNIFMWYEDVYAEFAPLKEYARDLENLGAGSHL